MLSAKTKGVFVQKTHSETLTLVTSSPEPPLTIERLQVFPGEGSSGFADFVSAHLGKGARYLQARTSVYPESRFFRRHTVETPAKLKEPAYLEEVMQEHLHLDSTANSVAVINAADGTPLDLTRNLATQKELLFTGASIEDLVDAQNDLLAGCVFPERLELATLAMVGGLLSYARFKALKRPVLAIELDAGQTNVFIVSSERVDYCRSIAHGLDSMLPIIQGELGLRDEESARKLLYSNTFDFAETGSSLLKKLLKELQATIGFHEVQTGQSIGHLFVQLMPESISWVRDSLAKFLGLKHLKIDYASWLASLGIEPADDVQLDTLGPQWFSALSLLPDFSTQTSEPAVATHATKAE